MVVSFTASCLHFTHSQTHARLMVNPGINLAHTHARARSTIHYAHTPHTNTLQPWHTCLEELFRLAPAKAESRPTTSSVNTYLLKFISICSVFVQSDAGCCLVLLAVTGWLLKDRYGSFRLDSTSYMHIPPGNGDECSRGHR